MVRIDGGAGTLIKQVKQNKVTRNSYETSLIISLAKLDSFCIPIILLLVFYCIVIDFLSDLLEKRIPSLRWWNGEALIAQQLICMSRIVQFRSESLTPRATIPINRLDLGVEPVGDYLLIIPYKCSLRYLKIV